MGLLMHLTCLPGPHGSGDLGQGAHRFIDFCAEAGVSWWQMLPVNPPGDPPGNAPYTSPSALAGNPFFVALGELGLLSGEELRPPQDVPDNRVDYPAMRHFREQALRTAYDRFIHASDDEKKPFHAFCDAQRDWLEDYALFTAIKQVFAGKPWYEWDPPLRDRDPAALAEARQAHAREIDFWRFVQYQFDQQWQALRRHAAEKGVALIGDIPIFVAHDSADVWAYPHLFRLNAVGRPEFVSGYPPDAAAPAGQKWGHPLYDWDAHRREGFKWWTARFASAFRRFDAVRIDHFLGFTRLWAIPASSPTAEKGTWWPTPGGQILAAVRDALGEHPIIAEDLGRVTRHDAALRKRFGLPGMRIYLFGFDANQPQAMYHRPHCYTHDSVAYTGTHDNPTLMEWLREVRPRGSARMARDYAGARGKQTHWAIIRAVMASPANTAIFPVQDVLGLGAEARMNRPGTRDGNWTWRISADALTGEIAARLRAMACLFGRLR